MSLQIIKQVVIEAAMHATSTEQIIELITAYRDVEQQLKIGQDMTGRVFELENKLNNPHNQTNVQY